MNLLEQEQIFQIYYKKTIGAIQVVGDIADTKYPSKQGSATVSVEKTSADVATTGLWSVEVGKEYLTLWNGTDKVTTFRPRLSQIMNIL